MLASFIIITLQVQLHIGQVGSSTSTSISQLNKNQFFRRKDNHDHYVYQRLLEAAKNNTDVTLATLQVLEKRVVTAEFTLTKTLDKLKINMEKLEDNTAKMLEQQTLFSLKQSAFESELKLASSTPANSVTSSSTHISTKISTSPSIGHIKGMSWVGTDSSKLRTKFKTLKDTNLIFAGLNLASPLTVKFIGGYSETGLTNSIFISETFFCGGINGGKNGHEGAITNMFGYIVAFGAKNTNQNEIVMDVGSNLGFYTLLTSKFGYRTYSFDPSTDCLYSLQALAKLNHLEDKVNLNNVGVGKEPLTLKNSAGEKIFVCLFYLFLLLFADLSD